jgi:NADH:ubiquinone oxidoreductase subunit 6 (subunit J)
LHTVIFYTLFVVIIASAFYISFGKNILSSSFSMFTLLVSASGIYVLLNSELFALINVLFFSGIVVLLLILFPGIKNASFNDEATLPKSHFISIIVLGILTALVSSLVSSTRWQAFEMNYEFNSLMLIFTKYLPLIILLAVISSIIITSLSVLLKNNNSAG